MLSFLHTNLPSEILIDLGFIAIHWYGFLVTIAVIAGFLVARYLFKLYFSPPLPRGDLTARGAVKEGGRNQGQTSPSPSLARRGAVDYLYNLIFYLVIFGLIGARLYHVLNEINFYWQNPIEILAIGKGGLAWHGGLIAGALVLYFYSKKHFSRRELLNTLDIFAPALALGQAIGRFGNYFNQELYGLPTGLPWGIPIAPGNRMAGFENFEFFQPTFLYESLALLAIFGLLMFLHKKRLTQALNYELPIMNYGSIFASYLILTSVARLLLELLRIDQTPIAFGIRLPIIASALLIIVAVIWLWYNLRVNKSKANESHKTN